MSNLIQGTFMKVFLRNFKFGYNRTKISRTLHEGLTLLLSPATFTHHTCARFLSSYSDLCLPNHCRCRGLLLHLVTLKDTLGRTLLEEGSARRRELYLTTHNTYKRQTSMLLRDSNPQSQQANGINITVFCVQQVNSWRTR
jgi:hypothetical protein